MGKECRQRDERGQQKDLEVSRHCLGLGLILHLVFSSATLLVMGLFARRALVCLFATGRRVPVR